MGHYKSNVRDLEFNLFEVFNVQDRLGKGPFEQSDEDTARGVLAELNNLADGAAGGVLRRRRPQPAGLRPDDVLGDAAGVASRSPTRLLWDGEWYRLGLPNELGGYGIPPSVQWAASELMLGANPARLHVHGRPELRARSSTTTAPTSRSTGPSS